MQAATQAGGGVAGRKCRFARACFHRAGVQPYIGHHNPIHMRCTNTPRLTTGPPLLYSVPESLMGLKLVTITARLPVVTRNPPCITLPTKMSASPLGGRTTTVGGAHVCGPRLSYGSCFDRPLALSTTDQNPVPPPPYSAWSERLRSTVIASLSS